MLRPTATAPHLDSTRSGLSVDEVTGIDCVAPVRLDKHTLAAAIPETFSTAWVNLFEPDIGRLADGENLLVQGGASGVGIAVIQFARELRGASIVATASSYVKRQLCLELGCRAAIDYRDADWPGLAKAATGGEGFDMILDAQAGS